MNNTHSEDTKGPSTALWLPPTLSKDQQQEKKSSRRGQSRPKWKLSGGFKDKTAWDYLNLLAILAIPVLIAAGTLWYTDQQHRTELSIAQDQQEETSLQTYLDRISDLLSKEGLATSEPNSPVRTIAHTRTFTLLPHINGVRKGEVVQFLYEANLLGYVQNGKRINAIIGLSGADLSGAVLGGPQVVVASVDAPEIVTVNLSGADLEGTNLVGANLEGTNLSWAKLSEADLSRANLIGANLSEAALSKASLNQANLGAANLNQADLTEANLSKANLHWSIGTTAQQLNSAYSLAGATLPDGSMHP